MSTTYIYPSNIDVDGRDIAIAFDEQELESLVKILKKTSRRFLEVSKPKRPLEIVEKDIPEPGARHVRKVQACGVCHTKVLSSVLRVPLTVMVIYAN